MQTFVGLLALSLALAVNASPTSRIVGGHDAPEGKYLYQAGLYVNGRYNCGGSIINKRYILTAGHCLARWKPQNLTVSVGSQKLYDDNAKSYKSEKFIVHGDYVTFDDADIGLIRLAEDVVFNDRVQPIDLPSEDAAQDGHSVLLSGWGRPDIDEPVTPRLQELELKIFGLDKCKERHSVTSKQVCTFTKSGEGTCKGDSGGPLAMDGVLVGIVSYGVPCAVGEPDVYTRVYAYVDWIAETMSHE